MTTKKEMVSLSVGDLFHPSAVEDQNKLCSFSCL